MASVVYGDANLFDYLSLHPPTEQFGQYIEQQNQTAMGVLSDSGRAFIERAKAFIPVESVKMAQRMATMVKNKWDTYWDGDTVRQLSTIEAVQLAPEAMKRWLLANPSLQPYLENDLLDGYSHYDTYNPVFEKPEENPYYLSVINGDLQDKHFTEYMLIDEMAEELSFEQKLFIKRAWALSDEAIEEGRDPTSKWDKTL